MTVELLVATARIVYN